MLRLLVASCSPSSSRSVTPRRTMRSTAPPSAATTPSSESCRSGGFDTALPVALRRCASVLQTRRRPAPVHSARAVVPRGAPQSHLRARPPPASPPPPPLSAPPELRVHRPNSGGIQLRLSDLLRKTLEHGAQ